MALKSFQFRCDPQQLQFPHGTFNTNLCVHMYRYVHTVIYTCILLCTLGCMYLLSYYLLLLRRYTVGTTWVLPGTCIFFTGTCIIHVPVYMYLLLLYFFYKIGT